MTVNSNNEDEITLENETPLTEKMNFNKDVLSLAISLIVSILFILFGWFLLSGTNFIYILLGLIVLTYGVYSAYKVYNNFGSALNYKKAQTELNGLYLRRNEPVCPYLKSTHSGFTCRLEFQEPFNIKEDLPKCHVESAYKKHWEEKAPNVFVKAQEVTNSSLAGYLSFLGMVRYEPAASFMEEIYDLIPMTAERRLVFEEAENIDEEALSKHYIDYYMAIKSKKPIDDVDKEKTTLKSEFDEIFETLTEEKLLIVDNGIVRKADKYLDPNFTKKWKIYSNGNVKLTCLTNLTYYNKQELIPKFLKIYVYSTDDKRASAARKGLLRLSDYIEDPILEYLNDTELPSDKKILLIDLGSKIVSDKIFEKIKELAESDDETISYYAVSALGTYDEEGIIEVLKIMSDQPTDLDIDAGRSALAKNSEMSFKVITKMLEEESNLAEEFQQILGSILEELDHVVVKKYFNELPESEQEMIDQVYDKHGLLHSLDYLLE